MSKGINYNNGQTKFDLLITDSDTALFRAAKSVQEDYVLVKNKLTGVDREFKLKTTFQGTKRTGEIGGFMGDINKWLGTSFGRDDFEITQYSRLKPDIENPMEEAEKQFAYFVKELKDLDVAKDYKICLGGNSNFRYEVATILPYKGERKEKPIIFADLREKILTQYKSKIILSDNCESDDTLGIYGTQSQNHFRKTGKYKYVLGYIDKDIKQVWGATIFLNRKEEGIHFITPFEAAHHFAFQLLKGDLSVDNIQGLPDLAIETKEKYGLRKIVGCGDVAATTILSSCTEVKELFEKVVECYKAYYKEDWKAPLKENAILLWMMRTPGQRFDIFVDLLDKLGVQYG
jgi:hypothetical protein